MNKQQQNMLIPYIKKLIQKWFWKVVQNSPWIDGKH